MKIIEGKVVVLGAQGKYNDNIFTHFKFKSLRLNPLFTSVDIILL